LGKPAVVQDWEILNLKLLLQEQVWEEVEGETLTLGDWVVVETGPFQGAVGRVMRLENESRVCLTLEHVGKAYVVSVPQHSLRLK
jgi:transcription antitermination factor NusG